MESTGDGVGVDPLLLTVTLVLTILLVFGNIYFLAHYSHHADSFFGSSTACKAILVSDSITIPHVLTFTTFFITDSLIHVFASANLDARLRRAKHQRINRFQAQYDVVHRHYCISIELDDSPTLRSLLLRD